MTTFSLTTPIIRELCRRGKDHQNFCEDSSLVYQDDEFIHIAVFDGCSTGKDSHFASFFFSRMLRKTIKESLLSDKNEFLIQKVYRLFESFYRNLKINQKFIDVPTIEFLSTIVYMLIDKNSKTGFGLIIGDGSIYVDGKCCLDINPPDNAPNYFAYWIERNDSFGKVWNEIAQLGVTFPMSDVSIMTDGIKSFKKLGGEITEKEIVDILLKDTRFIDIECMLERKCKILENIEKTIHTDDLSIIRVIL
jgi:hypothetical protein